MAFNLQGLLLEQNNKENLGVSLAKTRWGLKGLSAVNHLLIYRHYSSSIQGKLDSQTLIVNVCLNSQDNIWFLKSETSDNGEGNKIKPFRYHTPRNQQGPKEWNRPESSQKAVAFHSSPSETCFPQLCVSKLIITLAGASPASHGGRRKVERSEERKGWVSGTTTRVGARWCYATRIGFFPFLSSNTRTQVLTDFCLSDSCILHSSVCRGFSLFIASWFWNRQRLGCARGHCSNIPSWVTGKGEERDQSGKVHQNEACVKKNYESLWSCNSD